MADYANLPTVVALGGAQNLPTTNELTLDMSKKMWSAYPGLTPLTSILNRLAMDSSHNFKVEWIEEENIPTVLQIAQTEAAAGVTIYVVDGGKTLVKDTLLYNPRVDDLRLVDANETDNTITVTIDQGGKTSSIWQSGDVVFVLQPSLAEDDDVTSGAADAFRVASVQNSHQYNYQQICKLQFSMTRALNKMTTWFGGPGSMRKQLKLQKFREFRVKFENMCMFGGRATSGTAPSTVRQMGGLNQYLRNGTLFKNFEGTITESGWDEYLHIFLEENPDATKMAALMAPNVIAQIGYFAKDKIRISPNTKRYGLHITQYFNGPLEVDLIPCPLLTDSETRGWGWLLDFSRIRLRTIDKAMFHPDAKNIGESEIIYDTYRMVTSFMLANEKRHSMFVGATL